MCLPEEEGKPAEENQTDEGTETCPARLPEAVIVEDGVTTEVLANARQVLGKCMQNNIVDGDRDCEHRTTGEASMVRGTDMECHRSRTREPIDVNAVQTDTEGGEI